MAEQKKQDTGTVTTAASGSQHQAGGVGLSSPDPARNVGNTSQNLSTPENDPSRRDTGDLREEESREKLRRSRETRNPELDRRERVNRIMHPSGRSGERERLRQSGRDPDTVLPEDEEGKGNPSIETPDRIREKVTRDSSDTTLQETYRERDLTNGRQQTSDGHFRRDMIVEHMPRIPPSLLGTVRPSVDTPESIAMKQDDVVLEAMRAPTPEELYELGVHPDQQDPKVREEMKKRGVVVKKEAEEAERLREKELEDAEEQKRARAASGTKVVVEKEETKKS